MKRIILTLLLFMSFNISVKAEGTEDLYRANPTNLQIVESDESFALFATNDYRSGLFDNNLDLIKNHNFDPALIDNSGSHVSMENKSYFVEFINPVNLTGFYLKTSDSFDEVGYTVSFLSDTNSTIGSYTIFDRNKSVYISNNLKSVKKIILQTVSKKHRNLFGVEFFVDPAQFYASVENLTVKNLTEVSAKIEWVNPNSESLIGNKVYINDELFKNSENPIESIDLKDLKADTDYKITVSSVYENNIEVFADITLKTEKDTTTPPKDVTNLKATQAGDHVKLTYVFPDDADFSYVNIFRDNLLIKANVKETEFLDVNSQLNKTHTYKVIAYDEDGNGSPGVTTSISLGAKEVTNLQAKAPKSDRVELSWDNPKRSDFETVYIYRKTNTATPLFKRIFSFGRSVEEYDPLFETNGTIFNDLTVEADTKYTYKVTAFLAGKESDGKTVEVKTPKTVVDGGGVTPNPDPTDPTKPPISYTITWDEPTKGKIKVLIGGKEYTVVPAADKKVVIPAADMKFTAIGIMDVKLVPINDAGEETGEGALPGGGIPGIGDVTGENAPLNANNVLKFGIQLLAIVGGFVLLGLAFKVVPKLVVMIRDSFTQRRRKNDVEQIGGRRS